MNTQTGRIYEPEEYARRMDAVKREIDLDRHQVEFKRALESQLIVPVSDQVARQQRAGQRVEERRRKRKAAKAARRANR